MVDERGEMSGRDWVYLALVVGLDKDREAGVITLAEFSALCLLACRSLGVSPVDEGEAFAAAVELV